MPHFLDIYVEADIGVSKYTQSEAHDVLMTMRGRCYE